MNRSVYLLAAAALAFLNAGTAFSANVLSYDTRSNFNAASAGRAEIGFEDVRSGCITLADPNGSTIHNVFFVGGVARGIAVRSCSPTLANWSGFVLDTRLVHRDDAPAQASLIARLPAKTLAVAFDFGLAGRPTTPAATPLEVTVATDDGAEQKFVFNSKATPGPTGAIYYIEPVFAGFVSSRPIKEVRIRAVELTDSTVFLDNFAMGQWAAPSISAANGVVSSASFLPQVAPNSWITLFGSFFSTAERAWAGSDFNGPNLPTRIDDTSVTVGGRPTYVSWASQTQLNVLTPPDLPEGPADVVVTRDGLASAPFTVQVQRIAPALFMFYPADRKYAAASRADGSLVGDSGLYPGATTPARPGDVIILWGTGFGRTDPAIPAGTVVSSPGRLLAQAVATIGGATTEIQYAGLTIPGVYQFNIRVPDGLPDGDHPIAIQLEGTTTQAGAFLTVRK